MAADLILPLARTLDANAEVYAGSKFYFYASGTTTPQGVFADAGLTTPLTNPVVADSGGKFVTIYLDPALSYRGVVKNSTGSVTLHDVDPINPGILGALQGDNGADLIGTTAIGTGAVARTVHARLREEMYISDFLPSGFVTTGGTDYTTALQAAVDAAVAFNRELRAIPGTFDVTGSGLVLPPTLNWRGAGQYTSIVRNLNGTVARISGEQATISDLFLYSAGGGHTIAQTAAAGRWTFNRVALRQDGAGYSCYDNAGFDCIRQIFREPYLQHLQTATVPTIKMVGPGGAINNNAFYDVWAQTSGDYVIRIGTVDQNSPYGNKIIGFVGEICSGGGINLLGCKQFILDDIHCWDVDGGTGTTTVVKDFIKIERGPSGAWSDAARATTVGRISNYERLASTLATGVKDIILPDGGGGAGIVIENVSAPGDIIEIDAVGNGIGCEYAAAGVLLTNGSGAMIRDTSTGIITLPATGLIKIGSNQVLGPRVTGYTQMTGATLKSALATYTTPPVISGTYTQAEVQGLSDALTYTLQRLKAHEDAMFSHGIIGA